MHACVWYIMNVEVDEMPGSQKLKDRNEYKYKVLQYPAPRLTLLPKFLPKKSQSTPRTQDLNYLFSFCPDKSSISRPHTI